MHRYGGNEVVVLEEVECGNPGPEEVLVAVHAAGVNPVDWKIREGAMQRVLPLSFPYTFGCELSGVVQEVGKNVKRFRKGDAVFGYPNLVRSGAFAEQALMLEQELALAPASIPVPEAASLPVAVMTAMEGLYSYGRLEKGQRVLILGGSGGVGSAAIQLARRLGADVFATASHRNQQWLRDLGATPIDYTLQQTMDVVREVDLIFDTVGAESGIAALPSLRMGGRYVSSVYALPPAEVLGTRQAEAAVYGILPSAERLANIAAMVDSGELRMWIDRRFSLDEVPLALEASQSGRTRGKLLIQIAGN